MPNLVPTFPIRTGPPVRRNPDVNAIWKPSLLVDFLAAGASQGQVDYVRDAAGHIIIADPYTAWRQWCYLALQVPQAAHPIYPRRFGLNLDPMYRARPRPVVEADIAHRVRYLLTRSRRTSDVVDFQYTWSGAGVEVSCQPVPSVPHPPGAPFYLTRRYPASW